jgi:ribokinase
MRRSFFDVLAIGDCMLDVFVSIDEATVSCKLDRTHCLLSLPYGEKIPVTAVTKIPGAGNASNAAVGFARLGLATAIVSTIGHDDAGQSILSHWRHERIATHLVARDRTRETNYSTILHFNGERTILVYHQPYRYHLPLLPEASWIYYSSLGKQHLTFEKQLLGHLSDRPNTRLTFNPGTYQLRRGLRSLLPIIRRAQVFIINKEEAERLVGHDGTPLATLLDELHQHGARITVITDGVNGSCATNGNETWHCPIFPIKEIERTGAGDSFAMAFSYALLHDQKIPEALRYGTAMAASVVQFIGPQAGLLHQTKLETLLKRFHKIQATRMK